MMGYFGFVQVVEDKDYEKRRPKAYGGNPRTSSSNKQIVGYGGSNKRDIVQTTKTKYRDSYTHRVGIAIVEPSARSNQAQVRERTNKIKNENKTGCYERVTMKEKMTKGETHVEKSTGRHGIADEYKRSSTIKIGDKNGYTEYYTEDRVRRVNYDGSKCSSRFIQGNNKTSIIVNHGSSNGMKKNTNFGVSHGKNKRTSVSINYGNKKSINSVGGKHMAK